MADFKNIAFKGFQVTTATTGTFDKDIMYFVRTNTGKTDGYIQFNNKQYGTGKDVEATIKAILGTGVTSSSTVTAQLKAITDQLGTYNDAQASAGTKTDYISVTATTEHGQIKSVALANNVAVDITATTENGQLADAFAVKTALAAVEATAKSGHTTVSVSGDSESFITVTPLDNDKGGKNYSIKLAGIQSAIDTAKEAAITSAETYTNQEISGLTITTAKTGDTTVVQLKNKKGDVVSYFDAADFVKDGFLSGVTFVTGTTEAGKQTAELIFIWNTYASGGTIENQKTTVDVSKLIDIYTVATSSKTYMDITDYVASVNVTTSSALTDTAGTLADAKAVKDYVDDKVSNGAVQKVSSGKTTTDTYIDIKQVGTAVTIDSTDYTNTGISKAYTAIQNGTGDTVLINVTKNAADSGLTVSATTKLADAVASAETAIQEIKGNAYVKATKNGTGYTIGAETGLTQALNDRLTSVTVNGFTATTGNTVIKVDADDIELGTDISVGTYTSITATEKTNTVLADIYTKLSGLDTDAYSGVTATGNTNVVVVTDGDNNTQNVSVLREVATTGATGTISKGHIAIEQDTTSKEVYAVMYYGGDDSE